MKQALIFTACLTAIILTLVLRSGVHEIREQTPVVPPGGSSDGTLKDEFIALHYHEKRPYYMTYDGAVHGVVADPVRQAFEFASLSHQWVKTPATRQLDIIRSNSSKSCGIGWFKTEERQTFAKYSSPVYRDGPFVGITRADNPLLSDTQKLETALSQQRLRLLIKDSYSYGKTIDRMIELRKPKLVLTAADSQGMLEMILMQRADYLLLTEEEAFDPLLFLSHNKSKFRHIRFTDTPPGNFRYIICSKMVGDDELDRLNGAIEHLNLVEQAEQP